MAKQNDDPGAGATRGFGSMDIEKRVHAAREGGRRSGGNFKHNLERAVENGRKGGKQSSGNFAANPSRAALAGSKGGLSKRVKS